MQLLNDIYLQKGLPSFSTHGLSFLHKSWSLNNVHIPVTVTAWKNIPLYQFNFSHPPKTSQVCDIDSVLQYKVYDPSCNTAAA